MTPDSATWEIVLPMALLGVGNAFVWAPTSATATRNLPMHQAGAGAGVYNATRQVGAVLGSAAIAVLMDSRLSAQGLNFAPSEAGGGQLPAAGVHAVQRRHVGVHAPAGGRARARPGRRGLLRPPEAPGAGACCEPRRAAPARV